MLRRIYFMQLLLLCLICASIHAKGSNTSLVVEGKRWTYCNYLPPPLRPEQYNYTYWYELHGDTVIDNVSCLNLFSVNEYNDNVTRYVGALHEEEQKVYCFKPNSTEKVLLFDFGLHNGERVTVDEGSMILMNIRDEIMNSDTVRIFDLLPDTVAQYVSPEEQNLYYVQWVEGIGAVKDFFHTIPFPGNYCHLACCEIAGDTLYQYRQWLEISINATLWSPVEHRELSKHHYYDLQGRRLSAPPARGMYIQDKRVKILCR